MISGREKGGRSRREEEAEGKKKEGLTLKEVFSSILGDPKLHAALPVPWQVDSCLLNQPQKLLHVSRFNH